MPYRNHPKLTATQMSSLLQAVGDYLEDGGATACILVVGGAVLVLRGWVERSTQDIDVIAMRLPASAELLPPEFQAPLVDAIQRVALDRGLPADWLNTAVAMQWRTGLPPTLDSDIEWRTFAGLQVGLAGRQAMLALKLFAATDRGPDSVHCRDLLVLAPTDAELEAAAAWVRTQDAAAEWPGLVTEVIEHVRIHRHVR